MDKRFIAIILITLGVLGVLFWVSRDKQPAGNQDNGSVAGSSHTVGQGTSGVELVEFGDFQCPSCGFFFPILQQVKSKYGDNIKFTFRHFPLDSIHQNARAAHRAAEAASEQGKFWEMHDLLFQNQESWAQASNAVPAFDSFAEQLQLDMAKYKADYQSERINKIINADIAAGQAVKATSTPTFVLDGKVIDSETQQSMRTLDGFSRVIDEAIAKKGPQSQVPPEPAQETAPTAEPTPAPAPAQ